MPPVPRTTEVAPGAQVSIVLKADQKTGRQVRGTVRDVLTRGDHHRGIKVRLVDGRIGRVQSMVKTILSSSVEPSSVPSSASTSASTHPTTAAADASSNDGASQFITRTEGGRGGGGRRPRYRDMRLDELLEAPPEQLDLTAYLVPAKQKGGGRGKKKKTTAAGAANDMSTGGGGSSTEADIARTDVSTATATCPVCNVFEGDEAAVAHHVATHFE